MIRNLWPFSAAAARFRKADERLAYLLDLNEPAVSVDQLGIVCADTSVSVERRAS